MGHSDPEDFEYEPQEHDELAIKVLELVKTEVKAKMTETVDALEMFRKTNTTLGDKIRKLESQIRTFEPELKKALIEKEKELKRELLGGFTVGDTVFYTSAKSNNMKCEKCGGSHKLAVIVKGTEEERKIDCDKCGYDGKVHSYTYFPKKDTIRSAHLEMNATNKWLKFYLKEEDSERNIESIFKTEEECQAYCNEKNTPKVHE